MAMSRSEPFGADRWVAALVFLLVGFALLALALILDARITSAPQENTPAPVVIYGYE